MSQQYYFEKWRSKINRENHKVNTLLTSHMHAKRAQVSHYFRMWRHNTSLYDFQSKAMLNIGIETKVISVVKGEIS